MKASCLIAPVLLTALSFAVTVALRSQEASQAEAAAQVSTPASPSKSRHREEDTFAEIRKCLRAGDLDRARSILSALGERDPVAFFELLVKLPGFPGLDDIIASTAAKLKWNDPAVTALLNAIGPHQWRDLAWGSYVAPRSGIVSDEEIMEVGGRADYHRHLSSVFKVMQDAARDRPESFMALLNKMGGTSVREEFVKLVMEHHPELAGPLFKSIPDGSDGANYDRAYILQVRALGLPTAENLLATLGDVGDRGIYSSDFAPLCASHVFEEAKPEEKAKLLDAIQSLPDVAKNRMLAGPLLYHPEKVSVEDFTSGVGLYTSGYLQQNALERWMKAQPALDPADRSWVAGLPTEKLRTRAGQLLDEKAAAPRKAGP